MQIVLRLAVLEDVPVLAELIARSVRALQQGDYTTEQREGALGTVFGVDGQLIRDGTYFVAEVGGGEVVGCGGWSRRATLFGSDDVPGKDDRWLDPVADAARIRAFFVAPGWARRGIGSQIMVACERAAAAAGFSRLELGATLTGEPLYRAHGFAVVERLEVGLPNGGALPIVRMTKQL